MTSLNYFSLTFSHHPVNDLPFTVKQLLQVVFLPLPKGLEYRASILESNGTLTHMDLHPPHQCNINSWIHHMNELYPDHASARQVCLSCCTDGGSR